eukprot:NODE_35_length_36362_cov_0.944434.p4 type:complete len:564 gc:universal NODE_35_length_36362_cov_0.944434:11153-12844(+)
MLLLIFFQIGSCLKVEDMFDFSVNSYLKLAYPRDELHPLKCVAKNRTEHEEVMGDYMLTLVDSLTTAISMRQPNRLLQLLNLLTLKNFDLNSTVAVFEANIRVLGSLSSTALLLEDTKFLKWFSSNNTITQQLRQHQKRLISLGKDLGDRLMKSFATYSGIPTSKVNLRYPLQLYNVTSEYVRAENVESSHRNTNCASAGTLLLEFGMLSKLTSNYTYYRYARRALIAAVHTQTYSGLYGNEIDVDGRIIDIHHSLGGGIDSLYEYLLKGYVVFNDETLLDLFYHSYQNLFALNAYKSQTKYFFKFNKQCIPVLMPPTFHLNVNAKTGQLLIPRINGLAAFFPGLQILFGDVDFAFYHLLVYIRLLEVYPFVPEAFNINVHNVEFNMYLLRPEVYESMVFVKSAFKASNLEIDVTLENLTKDCMARFEKYCKTKCGYASLINLLLKKKEGRMESYFISETLKYMHLMFENEKHPFLSEHFTFTTEGHPIRVMNWKKQMSEFPLFNISIPRIKKIKLTKKCIKPQNPYTNLIENHKFSTFENFIFTRKVRKLLKKAYRKVLFNF